MFRDPGLGIRGTGTAASVELIAVGLVHGCVDLVGVCSRNLVREHLPVGGVAGAIDVRLRVAKPGAGQGSAAAQGRLFPGDTQERNRRPAAHRQRREPSYSCPARVTASPAAANSTCNGGRHFRHRAFSELSP